MEKISGATLSRELSVRYDGTMWRCYRDGVEFGSKYTFAWQALEATLREVRK